MSAERAGGSVAAVEAVLAAHVVHAGYGSGSWHAECLAGDWASFGAGGVVEAYDAHRRHVAETLAAASLLAAPAGNEAAADGLREADEAPFLSVPSGIDIAHYFWDETERRNIGCEGIELYREGPDYCYLWVDTVIDFDMWMAYLLDVRTSVGNPSADKFNETRDYLFLIAGAGGTFDVEWHNQPIRFDAPSEEHWERHEVGVKWLLDRAEKSIEDRDAAHPELYPPTADAQVAAMREVADTAARALLDP